MTAVAPRALRNGKSLESRRWRKGGNVDEVEKEKECGGCCMSHRDWSLCGDMQVRKTDNGSSEQKGEGGSGSRFGREAVALCQFYP